jgi:hypothetical protein
MIDLIKVLSILILSPDYASSKASVPERRIWSADT